MKAPMSADDTPIPADGYERGLRDVGEDSPQIGNFTFPIAIPFPFIGGDRRVIGGHRRFRLNPEGAK
jgi:hypothetical protein